MNRLTITQKKEALDNALRSFKFPEKYFIRKSDSRIGQKFAITTFDEPGSLNTHSNFMTYDEMNCFLRGYYNAINNPLK